MKKLSQFLLSLGALPFLLPWYVSERLFEFIVLPLIFKRFRIDLDQRKRLYLRIAIVACGAALVLYLAYKIFAFLKLFPTPAQALVHSKDYFLFVLNDLIRVAQTLLWPVNVMIVYWQGAAVQWQHLLLAAYCCFLPLLFLFNLTLRFLSTVRSLNKAVTLRNRAVRDVDLVHYAEQAKPDQIFLGLDLSRGSTPFYVKREWLKGHAQILGAAGSGKTESIVQPIWFQEVRRNVATFMLDGKGSRKNLERFYTIATSLAQGHEVIYFNPSDSGSSATYNPVLHGTVTEIRQKIVASLDGLSATINNQKERTSHYLDLILRAIKESGHFFSLDIIYQYLSSKTYLQQQLRRLRDRHVYEGLMEAVDNFQRFQADTEALTSALREICTSDYAWLLDTNEPEIDIATIYRERKDCYFTLPMHGGMPAMRFLGQLILQDMMMSFAQAAMQAAHGEDSKEALLIIDEFANFASASSIELLRVCKNAGVSVCYTDQSLTELNAPALHLPENFLDELANHTNAMFCFQLGSPESVRMVMERMGVSGNSETSKLKTEGKPAPPQKSSEEINAEMLKHLEVGRCVAFFRQPRVRAILKTGYFKFDNPLKFEPPTARRQTVAA
ncbi:hypothetical protein HUU05_22515 [candidate division KSB1 bacterium]|nr:hypothetical protein [candidate division KSB1 bacterium]